jgi:hypothetical protein
MIKFMGGRSHKKIYPRRSSIKLDGGLIVKHDGRAGVRAIPLRVKWSFDAFRIRAFPDSVSTESGASMRPTPAEHG